jgi:hypothetical protein
MHAASVRTSTFTWVHNGVRIGLLMSLLLSFGCKEQPPTAEEPAAAGSAAAPTVGPLGSRKIEKAVAEVTSKLGEPGPRGEDAPPPNGVLSAEQLQKEIGKEQVSVVTLGNAGSEPRRRIEYAASNGPLLGSVQMAVSTGPQAALPTVRLKLSAKANGAAESPGLVFTVKGVELGAEQPGEVPPGAVAELQKLTGTEYSVELAPSGVHGIVTAKAPKQAERLSALVSAGAEALSGVLIAFPPEPVGPGAFWMVKSREMFQGADTVTYRLVRFQGLAGDVAQLSVETKRYAATAQLDVEQIPPHSIQKFQAQGRSNISIAPGDPLVRDAQVSDDMTALLELPGGRAAPLGGAVNARFELEGGTGATPSAAAPGGKSPSSAVPSPAAPSPAAPSPAAPSPPAP